MREPSVGVLARRKTSEPRLEVRDGIGVVVASIGSLSSVELPEDSFERSKHVVNWRKDFVGTLNFDLLRPRIVVESWVLAEESFEPSDDDEVVEDGEDDWDG